MRLSNAFVSFIDSPSLTPTHIHTLNHTHTHTHENYPKTILLDQKALTRTPSSATSLPGHTTHTSICVHNAPTQLQPGHGTQLGRRLAVGQSASNARLPLPVTIVARGRRTQKDHEMHQPTRPPKANRTAGQTHISAMHVPSLPQPH
mmetsp:Transcript_46408/g.115482  ORF Transcript_46408/g.115482 Transcript_46408/m.115482 type:complete len:147 (-) Transcript_46408:1499-1939(-)